MSDLKRGTSGLRACQRVLISLMAGDKVEHLVGGGQDPVTDVWRRGHRGPGTKSRPQSGDADGKHFDHIVSALESRLLPPAGALAIRARFRVLSSYRRHAEGAELLNVVPPSRNINRDCNHCA